MLLSVIVSDSGVDLLLIAISFIILIGYVSEVVFRATKLPEVLILMFIGIILGPIGHILPNAYINTLRGLTPLLGSIALIMIMFNGGRIIKLKQRTLSNHIGYLLALADTILPGILLAVFMNVVFQWPAIYGALLGVILGETSTITIIPLIKRLNIGPEMYSLITMETTFNSVVSVLIFYMLMVPIQGNALSPASYLQYTVSYISIAVFVGIVSGFGWLFAQNLAKGARSYIATIAIAILMYAVVDFLGGAAVVSVLIYAIIIGNAKIINRYLKLSRLEGSRSAEVVEKEMEFLVRTFFFVLLGMISFLSLYYFLFALVITGLLIVVRKVEIVGLFRKDNRYKDLMLSLVPRGLTVAVLSSIYYTTGGPYSHRIFYISFVVLIITNIIFGILASRSIKKFNIRKN